MIAAPRPPAAEAPAELRGLRRDGVRLCVVDAAARTIDHTTVERLDEHLGPGDALVVNSSRTLPAALDGRREDGSAVQVRPAARRNRSWDALAVSPQPPHRSVSLRPGETLRFPDGLLAEVRGRREDIALLWRLALRGGDGLQTLLRHGRPIGYSYLREPVALEHLQTVYATHPGSAEMPSAGRPLTWELLTRLRRGGVALADIVLHCSLSSYQDDGLDAAHPIVEEWFQVGDAAAAAATSARRVIAVGTTVVRALESAALSHRTVLPARGWTELRIGPGSRLRAVDGLLTGLHEPRTSHVEMLGALADGELLDTAYAECGERGYLWHELGDSMLILGRRA